MIRQGSIDDFEIIKKIEKLAFNKFAYSDSEIEYMLLTAHTMIYENDEPEGYLSYYIESNECHVESIATVPKYKRKGVGSVLMRELEKVCVSNNKKRIVLEVRLKNKGAINFYRKHGFKELQILKDYYMLSYRGSRDAILMVKDLKEL
ncbi:MAG: ribosomal protein S18-alanine N-acetyltransferase [Thermoplasmata archaeon]